MPGMFQKALGYRGLLNGKLRGRALEIGVCVTASSGFLLLGYDQGIMGGIITEPSFLKMFPAMDPKNKSGAIQALVVAIYEIGCLLGAMFIVGYGDKLGRRRSILLGVSIMYIGAIIQAASFGTQLGQLIVGRIVTGVGNGMNTSTIPVWQSEMAPPKIRGFLVLFEGAMITAGIMISYWLNYGFWFVTQYGSFQWRFPIAFQIFFAILLNIGVLLMPESPRWLLKHGHDDMAREIMSWQYETDGEDKKLNEDIESIKEDNKEADASNLKWSELFSNKDRSMNLWRFSAACGAQAMQQLSGINLVTYYSTVVFEDSLLFSPSLSRFLTGWLGTEYFLAACLALFIVDRVGRRNLMMWGAAGMAGSLIVIGACLKYGGPQNKKPALVAAVFIFVYDTFFAVGWLGVGWLYPAEITSLKIRAQANGFSTMTNWIFNYGVVQLAPIMINTIAWKTYMVFMCTNLAAIPIVYFFLPETNGWKLEVLDDIFADAHKQGKNPVFVERHWRKNGWQKRQDSIEPGSESDDTKAEVGDRQIEEKKEEP